MRCLKLLIPMFLFAACTSEAAEEPKHPLADSWVEQRADGTTGMTIQFDTETADIMVHTAPREDGSHDHLDGSYTFDETTSAVSVKSKLAGAKGPEEWKGKLVSGVLTLSSADGKGKFEFKVGEAAH